MRRAVRAITGFVAISGAYIANPSVLARAMVSGLSLVWHDVQGSGFLDVRLSWLNKCLSQLRYCNSEL